MSGGSILSPVDPSGLGGTQLMRVDKAAPFIQEVWSYSSKLSFEAIQRGWLDAFPRAKHSTGVHTEGVRGGKRIVRVDRYEHAQATVGLCRCGHSREMHGILPGEGGREGCLSCLCRLYHVGAANG